MRWSLPLVLVVTALVLSGCRGTAGGPTQPRVATRNYRIPSSSMEPTLHCAKPGIGCLGSADDHVLVRVGEAVERDDIVVFTAPPKAAPECGEGGLFVKRIVGLPGETIREDAHGFFSVRDANSKDWEPLDQPYLSARAHELDWPHFNQEWKVPEGDYFAIGDNLQESCDSRSWGGVPRDNVVGPVVKIIRGS